MDAAVNSLGWHPFFLSFVAPLYLLHRFLYSFAHNKEPIEMIRGIMCYSTAAIEKRSAFSFCSSSLGCFSENFSSCLLSRGGVPLRYHLFSLFLPMNWIFFTFCFPWENCFGLSSLLHFVLWGRFLYSRFPSCPADHGADRQSSILAGIHIRSSIVWFKDYGFK